MILKALYDYYERKGDLPRKGMELKEIGFLIVIDKEGNFVRFEDRRIDRNRAQSFLVKKHVNRTSAPLANYLYDNSAYVLGYSEKGDGEKCFDTFKAKVKSILQEYPQNDDIKAIDLFYKNDREALLEIFKQDVLWNEIEKNLNKKFSTFSFLMEGESTIVASKTELINTNDDKDSEGGQMCLVSGMRGNIVETTTATMIPGSQATAKLVSFQVSSGYDSYGKNKGYNAPISEDAEFAYTTALNYLLRSDSQNKFIIGNRTFCFWASKDDEAGKQAEESIWDMFGFKDNDDPDKNIINVRKAFESIYSGSIKTTLDDRFYILGLAPNSARIAVTYWADIPLKDFSEMILRHFKDMEIVDTRKEKKPYFGLHSLLATVSLEGKSSNASPNLPDVVVKSIFQGLPYPQTLFASCIRRIRAEQSISITRAAILKAYLNRLNDNNNNKLTVMLDTSNTNQGYLCGRLFAVLDKIQDDANNQRSIKERYINSASATPAAVFSTILNLSLHHSAKLNERRSVYFEKIKQEIVDKISADGFPTHLDLQDQGRFFVGYYHQMQWFYTKNSDKEVDNND